MINIQSAIDDLPPVTWQGSTWRHGGIVNLPAGEIDLAETIKIDSPFVTLCGQGAVNTRIKFKGNGPAIEWTANPYNAYPGVTMAGGLRDLTIDGYGAGEESFGLLTRDIVGFHARGVSIIGFNKRGSAAWWDDIQTAWNERFNVEMELAESETAWLVTNNYRRGMGFTLGYGIVALFINCIPGGYGIRSIGRSTSWPAQMWNQSAHIIINGLGATAISLENNSMWHLQGVVHVEQNPVGLKTDWTSGLIVDGYSTGLYANQFGPLWKDCLVQRARQAWHRVKMTGQELC